MTDLSQLSDAELLALHGQQQQAPASPLAGMTDAQLLALHGGRPAAPADPFLTRVARTAAQTGLVGPAQLMSRPLSWLGQGIESVAGPGPVSGYLQSTPAAADATNTQMNQAEQAGAPGGFDWGGAVGHTLPTLPLGGLRVGGAALTRLAQGLLQGGSQENSTDAPTGESTAIGGAVSTLLPPAVRTLAGVIGGKVVTPAVQALKDIGTTLTPGQVLGGGAARAEQGAQSVPLLGDMIKNRTIDAFNSFNKGVGDFVLGPVGEKLPAAVEAGHQVISHVKSTLGGMYDSILAKGAIDPVPNLVPNLNAMAAQVGPALTQKEAETFRSILQNEIADHIRPGKLIPGETYKGIDSNLRRAVDDYKNSADYNERNLGQKLSDVRDYLRSEFDNQNPQVAGELAPVDEAYARYKRMEGAAATIGSGKNAGVFTPDALLASARRLDPSLDKNKFAQGNALMQELAQQGVDVLGSKIPDSGTAYRALLGAALLGAGGGAEHVGVPHAAAAAATLGLGSLAYTKPGAALLAAALTKRPPGFQVVGNQLGRTADLAGMLATPAATALANQGQ